MQHNRNEQRETCICEASKLGHIDGDRSVITCAQCSKAIGRLADVKIGSERPRMAQRDIIGRRIQDIFPMAYDRYMNPAEYQ